MKESKIISLLSKLDSRTLTRFGEYVASPYFNKHKEVALLSKYLLKEAPTFKNVKKLEKARVFKYVYGHTSFNTTKFHRLTSHLLQLLQNFLVDDAWQQNKLDRQVSLLRILRQYKLEKHYKAVDKQYTKEMNLLKYDWVERHRNQYNYFKEKDAFFVVGGGRSYDANLQLTNDMLDQFFILEKLIIACEMTNRNSIIRADYKVSMLEDIKRYCQYTPNLPPSIQIYYTIFQMLVAREEDAEIHYFELKKLLKKHEGFFNKSEIAGVYNHALNYAIAQINKKGAHYYAEALEHYLFLVEKEAIFVDGFLMPWDYKNIVTAALRLQKYTWTADFIEQYKEKLRPQDRTNVYSYNLAALQYSQQNYKGALQALYEVEFINTTYYQGAKIIQLKSYYELDEGEALLSLIDAFKNYLRRNRDMADYRKQSNLNLLRLTSKLYKLKEKLSYQQTTEKLKLAYHKLKAEIEGSTNVNNLDWLKQCLEKLDIDAD